MILEFAVQVHPKNNTSLLSWIWQELYLAHQFMRYDLTATIIPATLFVIAAMFSESGLAAAWPLHLLRSVVYFWLYIYIFNLSNQYVGYDEDRLNKPNRPLPLGLVTPLGVILRWIVLSITFVVVGWWFGVVEWALLWLLTIILHNWLHWSWHWFGKNFLMMLGTFAQLAAAWQLVLPLNDTGLRWVLMMAFLNFMAVGIQDLRDLAGDFLIGRRTLPMVMGEFRSRWYFAIVALAIPLVVYFVGIAPAQDMTLLGLLHYAAVTFLCLGMGTRVVLRRSIHADRVTYDWMTTWYTMMLGLAIWFV